jgi:glutamyl-Q tRNA(Asp) synthetase
VLYQSRRSALYQAALESLGDTYWCGCTRREIADSSIGLAADGAQIYPGTCRGGLRPARRRAPCACAPDRKRSSS